MATIYKNFSNPSDPSRNVVAVTPSDSTDLANGPCRSIYVGTGGNVALTAAEDSTASSVTFTSVPAGAILPVAARRIWSTNTTASNLVALY